MNSSTHNEMSHTLLPGLLLASVVLACAVAISPNPADADLWGHVQYGRDVLREGMHWTTTYSFTAEGHRWINHENLAELTLALLADWTGPLGLLLAKCLLGVTVILVVMRHSLKSGAGLSATVGVVLLLSVNLAYHWSLRPQLFSFACYTALLALLSFVFEGWEGSWRLGRWSKDHSDWCLEGAVDPPTYQTSRWKWLFLAAPLFVIWTNAHGGFAAGLLIFLAYLACRSMEAICTYGRGGYRLVGLFLLVAVAVVAATFINPYGVGLHRWMLRSLGQARPEITEWHPPDLFDGLSLPLWLLMASLLIVMAATRRSRDFTHVMILIMTLWQSLEHQRHIPFLAIAFAFWMPLHVQSVLNRIFPARDPAVEPEPTTPAMQRALAAGFCLALGLLGYRLYGRLSDLPVNRSEFPVSAIQYMTEHRLHGNLVVTYNWAQYAIAAFNRQPNDVHHPPMRVAFDGRFRTCYPQDVVDMHFDFILGDLGEGLRSRGANSPPFAGQRVLDTGLPQFGKPNLVLINRFQPHAELVMRRERDQWVLLYQDRSAQVWGRRSWYDDPSQPTYLPPRSRRITDAVQIGSVTWPALPEPTATRTQLASLPGANS